jgi:hypothetical protein
MGVDSGYVEGHTVVAAFQWAMPQTQPPVHLRLLNWANVPAQQRSKIKSKKVRMVSPSTCIIIFFTNTKFYLLRIK